MPIVVEKIVYEEKVVVKLVEVPTVIEKIVYVEKVVSKEADVAHVSTSAVESVIRAEVELSAPDAALKAEWQSKVDAHQARHPGGTLPSDILTFHCYKKMLFQRLSSAEQAARCCLKCGRLPY